MTILQTDCRPNNKNKESKAASSHSPINITNNANIRVISSGTGRNRAFAVIANSPRPAKTSPSPTLKKKVTPLWAKPKQSLPSPKESTSTRPKPKPKPKPKLQPSNQGVQSPTLTSPRGAALKRRRGVRKHASGSGSSGSRPSYDEPTNASDSALPSPEGQLFCTTPVEDYFSTEVESNSRPIMKKGPSTGRGTLYRYPSVFEDYFEEPSSAMASPIHTIEDLVDQKEKQVWGKYWTEDMHKASTARPVPQRTTTLEVKELIVHRRRVAGIRMDTMASWAEEEEL
ncbi:hypothetical protein CPB86DRAFT_793469 [Serendipita vermifera]|nr:hypothetical protein CPB86DRAFT_793469 [Serendipita vermifera]